MTVLTERLLGATGVAVSSYGLGTWTWGHETPAHVADDQLALFLEAGGSLVDTAPNYSGGRAERIAGCLLGTGSRRDRVFLCTKAGVSDAGPDTRPGRLLAQLHTSLRRLSTDHIDLWQLHAWSSETRLAESFAALRSALDAGKVRFVGVCNYTAPQLAEAYRVATDFGIKLASVQMEYSLLRNCGGEIVPASDDQRAGLLAWSPLAGGILTGKYLDGIPRHSRAADKHYDPYLDPYFREAGTATVLEVLKLVADATGTSSAQVALAWVREQPSVTSVLLGARDAAQLAHSLDSAAFTLPDDIQTLLSEQTR